MYCAKSNYLKQLLKFHSVKLAYDILLVEVRYKEPWGISSSYKKYRLTHELGIVVPVTGCLAFWECSVAKSQGSRATDVGRWGQSSGRSDRCKSSTHPYQSNCPGSGPALAFVLVKLFRCSP